VAGGFRGEAPLAHDRQYLKQDPAKRVEIFEVLALLASQPPARR
jgi:hypothetical protein